MNERLEELYNKHILKHSREPFNEGVDDEADLVFTAYNPMCGDKFSFYISTKEGMIHDAKFKGYGCAISKASSSILTKKVIGKPVLELKQLISDFLEITSSDSKSDVDSITQDEELLVFEATREFPEREQCATLGWKELERILNSKY